MKKGADGGIPNSNLLSTLINGPHPMRGKVNVMSEEFENTNQAAIHSEVTSRTNDDQSQTDVVAEECIHLAKSTMHFLSAHHWLAGGKVSEEVEYFLQLRTLLMLVTVVCNDGLETDERNEFLCALTDVCNRYEKMDGPSRDEVARQLRECRQLSQK